MGPANDTTVESADAAAAAWDARLRGAAATERDFQAFQAWLLEAPANRRGYDDLQTVLRALRSHADLPELSALRDEGRGMADASKRRRRAAAFAAAAAFAGIGLLAAFPSANGDGPTGKQQGEMVYATMPHEQTRVTLADGSLVTLASGTRMVVRLGDQQRDITLTGGRALFKVAKDSRRPFVVKAGARTITALGTLFDVRVSPHELRVTLAEGSVAVRPVADRRAVYHILKPKQQLVAVGTAAEATVRTVDVENALAWADRQFFFEDEPLASAIDEINRSSDLRIIVEPAVANLRINGMFRVSDTAAFIAALEMALPVDVRADARGRLVITRPADAKAGPAGNRVASS
jgi:transmembrane sensor